MKKATENLTLALSLASLTVIRVWFELFDSSDPRLSYYLKWSPGRADYSAVLVNILLLTGLYSFWIAFARREPKTRGTRIAAVCLLLPAAASLIGVLRTQALFDIDAYYRFKFFILYLSEDRLREALALLIAALFLFFLYLWRRRIFPALAALVALLSPLAVYSIARAAVSIFFQIPGPAPSANVFTPAPQRAGVPGRRILLLIFDEMDQRQAFSERIPTLKLPELDALRTQSIYVTNAYSPANETRMSVPALLSGREIAEVKPTAPGQLMVSFSGTDRWVDWRTQPSFFSEAHAEGFRTALVGWVIPYCDALAPCLDRCIWEDQALQRNSMGSDFPMLILNQLRSVFETPRFSLFGQSLAVQKSIRQYQSMLKAAREWAVDPAIDLLYIHLPVPHAPYIFDRFSNTFTAANRGTAGYLDNLALADRAIGDIRRAMHAAGLWKALLLSSQRITPGGTPIGSTAGRILAFPSW